MNRISTLTWLFIKQLVHSRSLWGVLCVIIGMSLFNYYFYKDIMESLEHGVSYASAAQQAQRTLKNFASEVRDYAPFLVVFISALVAPMARKNGTAQFLITMSVGRRRLALTQFSALMTFFFASLMAIHIGYVVAAFSVGAISVPQAALSWIFLVVPLVLLAAPVYCISLSVSSVGTYLIFLAVPLLGFELLEWAIKEAPGFSIQPMVRLSNNLTFLFPDIGDLLLWPGISAPSTVTGPPYPEWSWRIIHSVLSSCFWVVLGIWLYRNRDFGSRPLMK